MMRLYEIADELMGSDRDDTRKPRRRRVKWSNLSQRTLSLSVARMLRRQREQQQKLDRARTDRGEREEVAS